MEIDHGNCPNWNMVFVGHNDTNICEACETALHSMFNYSVYSFIATCDMCLHNSCCISWPETNHMLHVQNQSWTFLQSPQECGPVLREELGKPVKSHDD